MEHGIYSVFDKAAAAYLQPFFSLNDQTAIRAFSRSVTDGNQAFTASPEDYALCRLGRFDDLVGDLDSDGPIRTLITASAVVATTTTSD